MHPKKLVMVAVALVLVLSGVACGSSKKDTGQDALDASQSEQQSQQLDASSTTSTTEGSSSTTSGSDDGSALGGLGSGGCAAAAAAYESMLAAPLKLMTGGSQEQLDQLEQQANELQGEVPDELQADIDTVREAYTKFAEALKGVDFSDLFNGDTQKKFEEASKAVDAEEVKAAQQRISDYFQQNCSVG